MAQSSYLLLKYQGLKMCARARMGLNGFQTVDYKITLKKNQYFYIFLAKFYYALWDKVSNSLSQWIVTNIKITIGRSDGGMIIPSSHCSLNLEWTLMHTSRKMPTYDRATWKDFFQCVRDPQMQWHRNGTYSLSPYIDEKCIPTIYGAAFEWIIFFLGQENYWILWIGQVIKKCD